MPHLEGSEATIAYEQSGHGSDLVWVAGGGSRGSDWRLFQTPFFDDRYRSTTFDGRGIGDTTCELPDACACATETITMLSPDGGVTAPLSSV